ncbi:uncharacterized protein GBIM_17672, partial [Gryllus bimaculatus]
MLRNAPAGAATADGHTPLHLAALEGRLRAVSLLLAGAPASPWALLGLGRLRMFNAHRAPSNSMGSQVAVARRGSDGPQEAGSAQLDSPLHLAAQQGHASVAAELLRTGADPNAAGARGSTPLHQATVSGHVAAMRVRRPLPSLAYCALGGIRLLLLIPFSSSSLDPSLPATPSLCPLSSFSRLFDPS